eukprot:TRINITY_DN555_c0_g1_i2.p1 TRINITY_DN555_c0_g1~~TRINITY_DN555_c0_g1_i2.p1  ORF type:complete len:472 (-),score=51.53 TRINITY_DN555_c0_g1_i2:114-1529(-)
MRRVGATARWACGAIAVRAKVLWACGAIAVSVAIGLLAPTMNTFSVAGWCFCEHYIAMLAAGVLVIFGLMLWCKYAWFASRLSNIRDEYKVDVAVLTAVVVVTTLFLPVWRDQCRVTWTMSPFLDPAPNFIKYVTHSSAEDVFNKILSVKEVAFYYLVQGPHGCGKSTIAECQCGRGCLYIPIPEGGRNFELDIATHLHFTFDEDVSLWHYIYPREQPRPDTLLRSLAILKKTAKALKDKLGQPATLIIDETSRLLKSHSEDLLILQDFAKDCASTSLLRVIFISSEGAVPYFLERYSAASRMSVIDIGDFNRTESIRFLYSKSGGTVDSKTAEAIYNLTGGRASFLSEALEVPFEGMEAIKAKIMRRVLGNYRQLDKNWPAEVKDTNTKQQRIAIWRGLQYLLNSPSGIVPLIDFLQATCDHYEILEGNIFYRKPISETVTFQSQPVRVFAEDHLATPVVQELLKGSCSL